MRAPAASSIEVCPPSSGPSSRTWRPSSDPKHSMAHWIRGSLYVESAPAFSSYFGGNAELQPATASTAFCKHGAADTYRSKVRDSLVGSGIVFVFFQLNSMREIASSLVDLAADQLPAQSVLQVIQSPAADLAIGNG